MLLIRDVEAWLEQVGGRESGFSRALTLGDTLILNRNIFGETPQMRLTDWIDQEGQSYVVLRDRPWRAEKASSAGGSMEPPKFGKGSPPADLTDKEKLKHTDRRILSPIDAPLWDRAQWRGTLFACFPGAPPILAIAFEDGEAGKAIFRAWKDRWGDVDKEEALRVAIITGISKQNPAEYAVVVGPNLRHIAEEDKKVVMFVSRIQRMSPKTSTNLDNFVATYRKMKRFFIAPARISASGEILENPSAQFAIAKRQLDIREAWQIGENDPDISVLNEDDEPIVPEE